MVVAELATAEQTKQKRQTAESSQQTAWRTRKKKSCIELDTLNVVRVSCGATKIDKQSARQATLPKHIHFVYILNIVKPKIKQMKDTSWQWEWSNVYSREPRVAVRTNHGGRRCAYRENHTRINTNRSGDVQRRVGGTKTGNQKPVVYSGSWQSKVYV